MKHLRLLILLITSYSLAQDGTIDPTFNIGTGFNSIINTTNIQTDGKILVGGDFTSFNGSAINRILRLHTNGSIDLTFNTGSGTDAAVLTSLIQPDGKIILGGDFSTYNGVSKMRIVRLNIDGTVDNSFYSLAGTNLGSVTNLELQSDGKIIVGGSFNTFNGVARKIICRLNSDGTLDTSFNIGSGTFDYGINTLCIQPDGKILVGGGFTVFNGYPIKRINRLNTDGSTDFTFNSGGSGFTYPGFGIVWVGTIKNLPNNRIFVAGYFTDYNNVGVGSVIELNNDGSYHDNYTGGPPFYYSTSAIQSDGRVILGYQSSAGITRLTPPNGEVDLLFNSGTGFNDMVQSINLQSDNKIIVGGNFTTYNGVSQNRLVRLLNCSDFTSQDVTSCGTYQWNSQTYNSSGTFQQTFSNLEGCDSVVTVNLTVQPTIDLSVTLISNVLSSENNAADSFQWLDCNNNFAVIPNATEQSYTPSLVGSYAVQLEQYGCIDTSICVQINSLGLTDNQINEISFFPNPVTDHLLLKLNDKENISSIIIMSINGQVVYTQNIESLNNFESIKINTSSFAKGVYLLKIGDQSSKLIIE